MVHRGRKWVRRVPSTKGDRLRRRHLYWCLLCADTSGPTRGRGPWTVGGVGHGDVRGHRWVRVPDGEVPAEVR